eukprot:scaffold45005_cov260-Amphora_coffeaeformis.AAC.3
MTCSSSMRPCAVVRALFVVFALVRSVLAMPSSTTTSKSLSNVAIEDISLHIPPSRLNKLWEDWQRNFPPTHTIHIYDSHKNPKETLVAISEAMCFCLQHILPPTLVAKLQQFSFDPQAPCAMVIRGLPLMTEKQDIPPTPILDSIFQTTRQVRCPVAETYLLGISRLLGVPHASIFPPQSSIVRDIVPQTSLSTTTANKRDGDNCLPMHRDYPRQVLGAWEPEILLLLCVRRGNPECAASTVITDCRALYQSMSETDRELLKRYKIQTQRKDPDTNVWTDFAAPFYAVENHPSADQVTITLYNPPGAFCHVCKDLPGDDSDLANRVVGAYQRLSQNSLNMGQEVPLQPGDLLILNNARCVHGRTAYRPKFDGTDRWLVKTYVSNGFWQKPSQTNAPEQSSGFPRLDYSRDFYLSKTR